METGSDRITISQLNKALDEMQNNYNPTKAYSSVHFDGTNRYLMEGYYTTAVFKMLGKENGINMNTVTKEFPLGLIVLRNHLIV